MTGQPRDESLALSTELWSQYLPTARWFQAKGLPYRIERVTPLGQPYVDEPGLTVDSVVLDVLVDEAGHTVEQRYHVVVGYVTPGTASEGFIGRAQFDGLPCDVVDACVHPLARDAFMRCQCAGRAELAADAHVELLSFSSNTLLAAGDVLLKISRRLPGGLGAEADALRLLDGSGLAPRLLWTITGDLACRGDQAVCRDVLGIAMERLAATDGWALAVTACGEGRSFAGEARELGRTLRELHARFAAAAGTVPSAHVATTPAAELTARFLADLDAAADQMPAVAALHGPLTDALRVAGGPVPVQRVHGDFHLGQAMSVSRNGGWRIIDFEGEPMRDTRSQLDSPLRDVAGALRSFDYARAQAHGGVAWRDEAVAAFLDGYGDIGDPALLRAYMLDKALYEAVYETRNRPGWVHIPLTAIQDEVRCAHSTIPTPHESGDADDA